MISISPQRHQKLGLPTTPVVSLVLRIVAAIGLVGYISFWNGQKAIQGLTSKLVEEEDQVS